MKKTDNNDSAISGMISINVEEGSSKSKRQFNYQPSHTLVLPTRNLVLFPSVALPIQLGRESSIAVAEFAKESGAAIAIVCQRDPEVETPGLEDLYNIGTIARVIDVIELPNGIKTAIVEGVFAVKLRCLSEAPTLPGVLAASVTACRETANRMEQQQFDTIVDKIRETVAKVMKSPFDDSAMMMNVPKFDSIKAPQVLINTIATHLPFDVDSKIRMLTISSVSGRAEELLVQLIRAEEHYDILHEVMDKAKSQIESNQREGFLRQQMDVIRQELNEDNDDELNALEEKANAAFMPDDVAERFAKELNKIRRYNPQSPDYAVQFTYLETLVSMPWNVITEQTADFDLAEGVLENDHYGLRKVKDRILEQLAVIMNNPEAKAPILCLVGPPGVGKTSLGQSIANALGRRFQRMSLGGLHDEAEIRGHRRTYIGAMPGRIVDAMRRAGTVNPVILLDELDKIGADFKGDPAAALLEVLDPAQNCRFHDNYLDVDYDLSNVIFIATANTLSTISKPLLDRIEVIELSGYTVEEKIEIVIRHLIPRLLQKNGIDEKVFAISPETVKELIVSYTAESGVRQLEKLLESLMRKNLLNSMRRAKDFDPCVTADSLPAKLGPHPYIRQKYEGNDYAGVVTGLAWTSVGGEILLVEAAPSPGKGALTLTGNLGDVMKESATLAYEWVKVNCRALDIDPEFFVKNDMLLHFPEGAVPKDGPSAGITIATAIVSAIKHVRVQPRIAMTGEITLRGKVLPVGGIKEKILAAKRAGITEIIISQDNRKDVEDIEKVYTDGLTFTYITDVMDVIRHAVTDTPAK